LITSLAAALALAALPPCGPLDLDTAMGLAAQGSDEVAIRQAELAAARSDEALARALRIVPSASATLVVGPSPEARGNVLDSPNTNRGLTGLRPFGRVDVQVVQPLFTFGRLDAASDAAAAGVKAREGLVQDTVAQVQLRVVQLFWGISLAKRLLTVAGDVDKALDEADRRVARSLAAADGEVTLSDKYKLDLFRGMVRGRKVDAERGLTLARVGLAASIGVAPERLALRETPLDAAEGAPPDRAAALAAAERRRPDLAALDQAIAARDAEVRAEEAAAKPQLFLAGAFSYGYAPNRDIQLNPWVHDDFNLLSLGAVLGIRQDLSFPMLSARAGKARAEKAALERQRAGVARLVQVQVEGALADLEAARGKLAAARATLGAGRALFRSAGLDFGAGLIEARNLIESYGLFVESQVSAAQATYDLLVAEARLAQVTGEKPRGGASCEAR
jgi:outer membrane protein TolC